jgi:hypothetical protein
METCSLRKELSDRAEEILKLIISTNQQQIEALRSSNHVKLMQYDKELEQLVGKKERAFGALRQHTKEHGC